MGTQNEPQRDRGAALLEFVLVVPILLTLLVGLIDFGRAYSIQVQLQGAAREGARSLSIGSTSADVATAARSAAPGVTITTITQTPCAGAGTTASVTVRASFSFDIPFVPLGAHTITATAAMRCP